MALDKDQSSPYLFWPKMAFPKIRGTLFGGPYNKDPTFRVLHWGPRILGNHQMKVRVEGFITYGLGLKG